MGTWNTQIVSGLKCPYGLMERAGLRDFVSQKMVLFGDSLWVFVFNWILGVFGSILRYFSRLNDDNSREKESELSDFHGNFNDQTGKHQEKVLECDQFDGKMEEKEASVEKKSVPDAGNGTSKYQIMVGSSYSGFIEDPQTMSFTVHEMFVHSDEDPVSAYSQFDEFPFVSDDTHNQFIDYELPAHNDFAELNAEKGGFCDKLEVISPIVDEISGTHQGFDPDFWHFLSDKSYGEELEPESHMSMCEKKVDYDGENGMRSIGNDSFDQTSFDCDGIAVVKDVPRKTDPDCTKLKPQSQNVTFLEECGFEEEIRDNNSFDQTSFNSDDTALIEDMPPKTDFECTKHESQPQNPTFLEERSLEQEISDDTAVVEDMPRETDSKCTKHEPQSQNLTFLEEHSSKEEISSDMKNEHDEGLDAKDVLLEHKELIQKMKKEMRHSKNSRGLPTILEESESMKVDEDLKPLKIDGKVGYRDQVDEIQVFHKCYLDKMRKLDVLCHQTYALGLIQLKNQDQLASNKKSAVPTIKSLLAHNFLPHKLRIKNESDPLQKMLTDLQRDLEFMYVAQLCVSWEILKWQHGKAKELQANDPDGFRCYDIVAADFQQFQVLLQRFAEDVPFHQGPQFQNFAKSRCVLHNLLQVPQIKEDSRNERMGKTEGALSIKMLLELIGESMIALWDFLQADKDVVNLTTLMGIQGVQVDLQDPSDAELLTEVLSDLYKKERKLKDLVRSGNCIVKKFQKHRDRQLRGEMLLAHVELRLVARVLKLSRLTTEQLLWCHKKLNNISIIGRKIHVESSILLFPC